MGTLDRQGRGRGTARTASVGAAACVLVAALILAGCAAEDSDTGRAVDDGEPLASADVPDPPSPSPSGGDPADLVAQAVAAWEANDPSGFVARLAEARDACSDEDAARRLAEVSAIADRWSAALADGRPKVQATTENQLSGVDWEALAAGCSQA